MNLWNSMCSYWKNPRYEMPWYFLPSITQVSIRLSIWERRIRKQSCRNLSNKLGLSRSTSKGKGACYCTPQKNWVIVENLFWLCPEWLVPKQKNKFVLVFNNKSVICLQRLLHTQTWNEVPRKGSPAGMTSQLWVYWSYPAPTQSPSSPEIKK